MGEDERIINNRPLLELIRGIVIASAVTAVFYWLFFRYSAAIWSFNIFLPLPEFTPWKRMWVAEHDGLEGYVLYAMMYAIIAFTLLLSSMIARIKSWQLKNIVYFCGFLLAGCFYAAIRFHPPMLAAGSGPQSLLFMAVVAAILLLLVRYGEQNKWLPWALALVLLMLCLGSTNGFSLFDYNYVLTPALRIIPGFKLNESYFQYDYLLSLFAVFWLKLHLSAYSFYHLAEVSYFILLAGIYLFARKFFRYKQLAIYLLVSLVLIKIYGNMLGPAFCIQVTPLRLDWWLAVLVCAYWKGIQHWLTGLLLGLLIVFHHVFGLIYAFSYISFILILAVFALADKTIPARDLMRNYYHLYTRNISIIAVSFLVYRLFLAPSGTNTAVMYQEYGIGFLPISRQSFYWYLPVVFALIFFLGRRNRDLVPEKYLHTSWLLVLLAIGNSLYFFGRSHEHNIINVAGSLVFCLFTFFDLAHSEINKNNAARINRLIFPVVSFILVLGISYVYSGRAVGRIKQQYAVGLKPQTVDQLLPGQIRDEIKDLTGRSPKVIFMTRFDFPYYFEGGYVPQGYYCFTDSWLFLRDYSDFLNARLAQGWYLVMPLREETTFTEVITALKYKNKASTNHFLVLNN